MKKIIALSLLFVVPALISACGGIGKNANEAEKVGERFYKNLENRDYDIIITMLDPEAVKASPVEDWKRVLENKEAYGELESWSKKIGFHSSINNGVSTVTLNYKTKYTQYDFHEKIIFVKRGDKYKILRYEYNTDVNALSAD